MKTTEEWRRAFGSADAAFVARVHRTLADCKRDEEEPVMRRKIGFSVALAALACLLLAAVAFAAAGRLGVLDFIVGRFAEEISVLPKATEIIESTIEQSGGHTEHADFTLRQAVFDGKHVYLVVAIKPADDQTLLLGVDSLPDYPVSDFGPRFEASEGTIADYAREIGRENFVHTNISAQPSAENGYVFPAASLDFMLEEDGTLVYMIHGGYEGVMDMLSIELSCLTAPIALQGGEYETDLSQKSVATLSFTLKASEPLGAARNVEPVAFTDCGVRVDEVVLTATPMAVYTRIRYTVVDSDKFAATEGGLWFEFLDAAGERLTGGATAGGSVETVEEADGSFTEYVQTDSLSAMESLPDSITLRGYNCWDKNRYEAHEIALQ